MAASGASASLSHAPAAGRTPGYRGLAQNGSCCPQRPKRTNSQTELKPIHRCRVTDNRVWQIGLSPDISDSFSKLDWPAPAAPWASAIAACPARVLSPRSLSLCDWGLRQMYTGF